MATNLMRFDPFSDIARLDPFRNIEDIFRDFSMMPVQRGMQTAPQIRMDISETDQAYMIKADIPGVSKEDIKIAIEGNQVSVSAETKEEKDTSTAGMLRSERYYGQQYRSFSLPQDVGHRRQATDDSIIRPCPRSVDADRAVAWQLQLDYRRVACRESAAPAQPVVGGRGPDRGWQLRAAALPAGTCGPGRKRRAH
jgi:HSP20 family protein